MQKICLLIKIVYICVRIDINLMMYLTLYVCTVGINEYSRIRNTVL
jgi:hypothetical protein